MNLINIVSVVIGVISLTLGIIMMVKNIRARLAFFIELVGLLLVIGALVDTDATLPNMLMHYLGI